MTFQGTNFYDATKYMASGFNSLNYFGQGIDALQASVYQNIAKLLTHQSMQQYVLWF